MCWSRTARYLVDQGPSVSSYLLSAMLFRGLVDLEDVHAAFPDQTEAAHRAIKQNKANKITNEQNVSVSTNKSKINVPQMLDHTRLSRKVPCYSR